MVVQVVPPAPEPPAELRPRPERPRLPAAPTGRRGAGGPRDEAAASGGDRDDRDPRAGLCAGRGVGLALAAAIASLAAACGGGAPGEDAGGPASADSADTGREFLRPQDAPAGRWRKARTVEEKIEELEAIGYASGYEPATAEKGVTVHAEEGAWEGYNLYVSGHGPEALLVDMEGRVLHRWRRSFDEALPDFRWRRGSRPIYRDFYRRAHVYPNGDLLAIFEGHALVKLDRDSNVLWTFPGLAHHDLEVLEDGRIFVLTRKASVIPRVHPTEPVLEDFVTILGPDGDVRRRVSVLECFEGSEHASLLERVEPRGDFFHTNTIEVLDGRFADRHPAFERGNVLVSVLRLDTIAVLDVDEVDVVWALTEGWVQQHQPTFLDSGEMLLFDNLGGDDPGGRSRVMQFDPVDYELTWLYEGDEETPFQSDTCGSCQRLPNGNTLVTESDNGRAFEVDPEGEIVWEFMNPHRAGHDDSLVATLFEVVRLPPDFPVDWARGLER